MEITLDPASISGCVVSLVDVESEMFFTLFSTDINIPNGMLSRSTSYMI